MMASLRRRYLAAALFAWICGAADARTCPPKLNRDLIWILPLITIVLCALVVIWARAAIRARSSPSRRPKSARVYPAKRQSKKKAKPEASDMVVEIPADTPSTTVDQPTSIADLPTLSTLQESPSAAHESDDGMAPSGGTEENEPATAAAPLAYTTPAAAPDSPAEAEDPRENDDAATDNPPVNASPTEPAPESPSESYSPPSPEPAVDTGSEMLASAAPDAPVEAPYDAKADAVPEVPVEVAPEVPSGEAPECEPEVKEPNDEEEELDEDELNMFRNLTGAS